MRRSTRSEPTFYDDPTIYDILMTPGTARELDVLERIARRYGLSSRRKGTWLEPACGTGRFVRLIAARGRRVLGFDHHPGQLAYARRRLRRLGLTRRARLFEADMTEFVDRIKPASIDFAFIPVNSLRHLTSDAAMLAHFHQMAGVLRPDGLYAVGISLRDDALHIPEEDVWTAARGRCRVTQVVTYLPPPPGIRSRRETVISHLMIARPGGIEHRDARYELRTYRLRQWLRLVNQSALRRLAVVDARGRPLPHGLIRSGNQRPGETPATARAAGRPVPNYQIEILTPRF